MTARPAARFAFVLAMVAGATGSAAAAWPGVREVATPEAFGEGTLDGTQVDAEGRLTLAPEFRSLWGPEEGIVWAVAPESEGAAWVATSAPARLLRVTADGEAEVWFEGADEALVTAAVPDGAGGVFLAVSPGGRVLHARKPGDAVSVLETEAEFVWSLARADSGALWIGTGEPGRLLRHSPDGETTAVLESADDPVRCLKIRPDGRILAGTARRGRVIRIDPDGDGLFVLLDAEEEEIVSVAADDGGRVFALAADGRPARADRPDREEKGQKEEPAGDTGRPEPAADADKRAPEDRAAAARRRRADKAGGALYRIDPRGGVWKIWQTTSEMPHALEIDREGLVVVATGASGKIFRVDPDGRSTRLLRFPSESVSSLAVGPRGRLLLGGTADARLAVLGPAPAAVGRYVSQTFDAGSVARWGRIRWDAEVPRGAKLVLRARAGNTAEADETWSDWEDVDAPASAREASLSLPAARWMQLQAELTPSRREDAPVLRRFEIHYQPRNRPPAIPELRAEPAGIVWSETKQPSNARGAPLVTGDPVSERLARAALRGRRAAVRKTYERGARTCSWTAEDPDGDALAFTLEIRREGDDAWFPLAHRITERFFSWDSRAMPDGLYRLRLTADDSAGNPPGESLTRQRISEPFRIDNTAPLIRGLEVRREPDGLTVTFEAADPGGRIASAQYRLGDAEWRVLEPVDGVADSEVESYRFSVGEREAPASERHLGLRVADVSGNLGGELRTLDAP